MRRRQGFTLVEVTISAAILAVILLLLSTVVTEGAAATKDDLARNEAMAAARKIVAQLTRELGASGGHEGGSDHVDPTRAAGGSGLSAITFSMRSQLTGVEATDWGLPITYQLEGNGDAAGDGDDDDGDGVFDERRLVRIETTATGTERVTLDESVTEFTIERAAGSDMITITLEVSRRGTPRVAGPPQGPQDWIRARVVTNVFVRNRI